MKIDHNAKQLTDQECHHILKARWFSYVYGVGLTFLSNGSWDYTDSVSAKASTPKRNP